jgi:hypothetical protein
MRIKLSQVVAKVPANSLEITNMSFEIYDITGLVILEGWLMSESGEPTGPACTIPVQLSDSEIRELFSVVKTDAIRRRKKIK